MSVILVKKEKDKIIIASDSQETYGDDCQENVFDFKLREVEPGVFIGSAGNAHVCSMLYAYIEENSILEVNKSIELINYYRKFSDWIADILQDEDDKINPATTCQFIIIIKDKVWQFVNYYVREINIGEYASIGSGSQTALACTKLSNSMVDIIKAVCSTNTHCSEPIKIIEIKL